VWVNLYGHTSPGEFAMANTDVLGDVLEDSRRNDKFAKLLHLPRVEVGGAIPIGCLVSVAAVIAIAVMPGVIIGTLLQSAPTGPREAVVRVIDDGAKPGPKILSTQVFPLR
jgi:hypothetical protein